MSQKHILILLALVALLALPVQAATTYSGYVPFIEGSIKSPGIDDPFPGLGNNFCALNDGVRTMFWNPASLGKIGVSETYFSITTTPNPSQLSRSFTANDPTMEVAPNFPAMVLLSGNKSETTPQERTFLGFANYSPLQGDKVFMQAFKYNDTFSFGVATQGNSQLDLSLVGDFPSQIFASLNLYNSHDILGTGMSVGGDGKLTYAYSDSLHDYTVTSESSVWGGFLSQQQRVGVLSSVHSNNSMNVQPGVTLAGAGNWNGIAIGASMTPISSTINIDNSAVVKVVDDAPDAYFYIPNFDPTNPIDAANWALGAGVSSESGYIKKYIRVPHGEAIGEARYNGFFQASTNRLDMGLMYDFGKVLTVGMKMENLGGQSLNFSGTGQTAYVDYRPTDITTGEIANLLNPANKGNLNLVRDTYSTVEGTQGLGMPNSFSVQIPQRTKIGVALHLPILLTLDYEIQNNPLPFQFKNAAGQMVDGQLTNIRVIRGGAELPFFFCSLRGGAAVLWKPAVSNLDADSQKNFDKLFPIMNRFMPLSLNLGAVGKVYDYRWEMATGFEASNLLSVAQLDTLNLNPGQVVYSSFSIEKDPWHFTWAESVDLLSTAAAYGNAPASFKNAQNKQWTDYLGFLKWNTTLTFGFSF